MVISESKNREEIIAHEKKLLAAFSNKDLVVLDELIHDEALFVLPNGQAVTKSTVLDNYREGNMAMTSITSSDQKIHLIDDTAVVSMILALNGSYLEEPISSQFRYIRVWKLFDQTWKVIATSGVAINQP
jgi:ketosteroid isomerase-like protein